MLTFLRKIRKSLIETGSARKYLLYAIGEILLVMIGILLALQVNNWNNWNKDRELERSYLNRLSDDLKSDTIQFKSLMDDWMLNNQIISEFTKAINDPHSNDSTLLMTTRKYLEIIWSWPIFTPTRVTYDELSNTGNLNLIQNVNIREAIIDHYSSYALTYDINRSNWDWLLQAGVEFWAHQSIFQIDHLTAHLFDNISETQSVDIIQTENMAYSRHASNLYFINAWIIGIIEVQINKANDLMLKIETELLEN